MPATHGNTLTGFDGGGPLRQTHLVAQGGGLRALTPTEWERLSGFPDGWTIDLPTSERWATLGDCFHVGTAEWLGRRLVAVNDALAAHPRIFDAPHAEQVEYADAAGQLALFG